MRYMLISIIVPIMCIFVSALITRIICHWKPLSRKWRALLAVGMAVVLLGIATLSYFSFYSPADSSVRAYLQSGGDVAVTHIEGGYAFDGAGTDVAAIFYPGAKIEATAYAPLLYGLAARGVDSFLIEMPLHIAVFDTNAATRVMAAYNYEHWVLMGHSLGGSVASIYAAGHEDGIDGLVLLGSYPSKPVNVSLLSIYGSLDGCLERDIYEEDKALWPEDADELVIDGGNHAQFGNYGAQSGDNPASITAEEQQRQTIDAITRFIQEIKQS